MVMLCSCTPKGAVAVQVYWLPWSLSVTEWMCSFPSELWFLEITRPPFSQSMELTPKSEEQVTDTSLPRENIPCSETLIPMQTNQFISNCSIKKKSLPRNVADCVLLPKLFLTVQLYCPECSFTSLMATTRRLSYEELVPSLNIWKLLYTRLSILRDWPSLVQVTSVAADTPDEQFSVKWG